MHRLASVCTYYFPPGAHPRARYTGGITMLSFFPPFFLPRCFISAPGPARPSAPVLRRNGMEKCFRPRRSNVSPNFFARVISALDFSAPGSPLSPDEDYVHLQPAWGRVEGWHGGALVRGDVRGERDGLDAANFFPGVGQLSPPSFLV